MSFDIVYIVSHGFASRMVTQTNLLGKLVAEGKAVALIAPDKSDPNLKAYCTEKGIGLYEFNENNKLSNQRYIQKRKYFLEDLENNPALMEKHIYSTRYNKSLNPLAHIWPRYYRVIYGLRKKFPRIKEQFIRNERIYLKSESAKSLIEYLNPKKLIATYPINFNEATLLYHGNQNPGTQTWIHLLSWDNITCKGYFPEVADKYIVWGEVMKDELMSVYQVDAKNIYICGVPHFDLHYQTMRNSNVKKFLMDLKLCHDKPYIFFAMSSPRFAPKEIDIVEWLAEQIEQGTINNLQMVVRPHPQNVKGGMVDLNWLTRLERIKEFSCIAVDYPDLAESKLNWSMDRNDMDRLANLIAGASVTLNSGSTVSIDALIQGKPVIITSFDASESLSYWQSAKRLIDYPHLRKFISFGGVTVVRSFQELKDAIQSYLQDPSLGSQERVRTIENHCSYRNGEATARVVDVLAVN